jgi:hypothetical protein
MTAATAVISVSDSTDRHHSPSTAPSAALYTYLSFWTSKETYYLLLSTTRGQSFFSPSASLLIIFSRTNCLFPKCRDPVLRNLLVILFWYHEASGILVFLCVLGRSESYLKLLILTHGRHHRSWALLPTSAEQGRRNVVSSIIFSLSGVARNSLHNTSFWANFFIL